MQEIECQGMWWLPTYPDEKVVGTLSFSNESGVTLSLSGTLGDTSNSFTEKGIPIVLGSTWDCHLGPLITLRNCNRTGTDLNIPGILRERYWCENLFAGGHLESDESFYFSGAHFQLSKLASWAQTLSGLSTDFVAPKETTTGEYNIHWRQPKSISGRVSGATIRLGTGVKTSGSLRKRCVEEILHFQLDSDVALTFEEIQRLYIVPLRNFLTLGTDSPNALTELSIRGAIVRENFNVLIPQVYFEDSETNILPYKMLFTLSDFQERIVDLIDKWLEISVTLKDVFIPFFGIQYKPDIYVDLKFLIVFQCIEVYLRLRPGESNNNVRRSSDSLELQLEELLNEHWSTIGAVFGESLEKSLRDIVELRNYVVHRNSSIGERPDYGSKLFWSTQRLMFLMKACLLDELGISAEERLVLFKRNQLYSQMLSLPS
ncbi:MAG TPA: HEPN domain-containing protein [Anaerolineales bacterium]|nr:HEPN domain-containing protein [Anaerolineales bacterium]